MIWVVVKDDLAKNNEAQVGKTRPITVSKKSAVTEEKSPPISLETMQKMKVERNLTTNQVIRIAKDIR